MLLLLIFMSQRVYRARPLRIAIGVSYDFAACCPLGILIGNVQRFNFLQIGRQRNLIYAVFWCFVALLYLSFVRSASLWLEPYLPPEATAALLLFLARGFL